MTIDQMRRWLLDARPNWRRETIMAWHDSQVIAIFHKEFPKGSQRMPRTAKGERMVQLTLF